VSQKDARKKLTRAGASGLIMKIASERKAFNPLLFEIVTHASEGEALRPPPQPPFSVFIL